MIDDATAKRYIESGGVFCPFCGSYNIGTCGDVEEDEGGITKEVQCDDCGKHWNDTFGLVAVKEIEGVS